MKFNLFRIFHINQFPIVLAIVSISGASMSEGGEPIGSARKVISTSICSLVSYPQKFNNKMVRVRADFETDGFEHWSLIDPVCPSGGVMPYDGAFDPEVAPKLLEALGHGCHGTSDKRITATWQGVYHRRIPTAQNAGMILRWINVEKVDDLVVAPKDNGVSCPSRP